MNPDTTTTSRTRLASSRLIAGGLIAGVTLFALVAWVMVQTTGPQADPAAASLMFAVWAALAAGGILAALVVWRGRIAPLLARNRGRAPGDAGDHDMEVQTALIISWALLEGPALFGVVLYLLHANLVAYAGGVLLVWLGVGLTFPRRHWFAAPDAPSVTDPARRADRS